ncbi:MAG: RHS repeat-associated core domain-containing protein [Gammaproteobacteria bacterium]|nr:RHS repeat-associated core domain-containing protein [Gammaproteobacteria bacterium]
MTNTLESYYQTYAYDLGNNLITLSHQANSNTWQQIINLHPNNNRGTETQSSATDFDANGNLLTLNNIGHLGWHYNNRLNKLTKQDKTTEYYVYDHQGNRIRTVIESNRQIHSQKSYLPSLDISSNETKQTTSTLHIGTHILSEISKDNTQTRYQLASHLQSNTLELSDKAEIISYEHYYPYGGTAIVAGKNKTQVQQKRYRYTSKERDDNSGLSYYGARYLAPWMARWISPDSAGAVDGLNLYVYVSNNPLKYLDPTGHVKVFKFSDREQENELYELNILNPVSHDNRLFPVSEENLIHFPEGSQRLEETVKLYSINGPDKFNLLETNTKFTINPNKEGASIVEANYQISKDHFRNSMDFSTGQLKFSTNYRVSVPDLGISATEITNYQYLGMTRVAKTLNLLPKTFLRSTIEGADAQKILNQYKSQGNSAKFLDDFTHQTVNGRSSVRVADAFGLKITSIDLDHRESDVYLHLQPQHPLQPIGKSFTLQSRDLTKMKLPRREYHRP